MPPLPEATECTVNGVKDFIPELNDESVQGDYQENRHYCRYHAAKLGTIPTKPSITAVISDQFTSAAEAGFIISRAPPTRVAIFPLENALGFFSSTSFFLNIVKRVIGLNKL